MYKINVIWHICWYKSFSAINVKINCLICTEVFKLIDVTSMFTDVMYKKKETLFKSLE